MGQEVYLGRRASMRCSVLCCVVMRRWHAWVVPLWVWLVSALAPLCWSPLRVLVLLLGLLGPLVVGQLPAVLSWPGFCCCCGLVRGGASNGRVCG